MQNKFSVYLTSFRKDHSTQHALLKIIETWKAKLNIGHKLLIFAAILCALFRRYFCYVAELNYFYENEFNCLYEYGS